MAIQSSMHTTRFATDGLNSLDGNAGIHPHLARSGGSALRDKNAEGEAFIVTTECADPSSPLVEGVVSRMGGELARTREC